MQRAFQGSYPLNVIFRTEIIVIGITVCVIV